jgi:DNA polymerase delta subunit 1
MKRTVSTGSNDSNDGLKKSRGDNSDCGRSFEEELMMMEEMEQEALSEEVAAVAAAGGLMDFEDDDQAGVVADLANTRKWQRPLQEVNDKTDNLAFQWLDIDMASGEPWMNPQGEIFGSTEGPVPVIRLYGVTSEKSSVMLTVHGFTPYMYVSLPTSLELSDNCLASIRATLDMRIKERARGDEKRLTKCILGTERVRAKQSLLGYHFETTRDFLKVYVAMPSLIPATKRAFDEGFAVAGFGVISGQCYEANVPYILRFMIDKNINGADWVECPATFYKVRPEEKKVSRCTLEADIDFDHLMAHECTGIWQRIAPLRVLSFDIGTVIKKFF